MAENPATWGKAEKIISQVLADHDRNMRSPEPVIGWSLPKQIAEALRKEGLLKENT